MMNASMNEKKEKNEAVSVKLPEGFFSSGNCIGCKYWYPEDRDFNGRGYCAWYKTYYYPRERGGCLSREELYR